MELIHLLNEMLGFVVNFEWHFLTSSRLLVWSCASSAFRFSAFFDPLWSLQFFVCVLFYVSLYLYRKCWLQRRVQVERAASIKENCQFVLFNSFIVTANGPLSVMQFLCHFSCDFSTHSCLRYFGDQLTLFMFVLKIINKQKTQISSQSFDVSKARSNLINRLNFTDDEKLSLRIVNLFSHFQEDSFVSYASFILFHIKIDPIFNATEKLFTIFSLSLINLWTLRLRMINFSYTINSLIIL